MSGFQPVAFPFRCHASGDTPSATRHRATMLQVVIAAVSSTIWPVSKCCLICVNTSSVTLTSSIAKKLDAQGIDVVGGSPEVAKVFIEKQMDIWAKVVKDNNIKAD